MDMTVEVPELPELTFDEASHIYRLNGDIIPSVSELMEPLKDQCYGGISKRTLENAAIKGSAVHNSIENWIKFGIDDIPSEHRGYFNGFVEWWKQYKPRVFGSEVRIYHKLMRYPDIGAPNWEIIVAAAAEQIAGAGLILWTCREGELLENALEACARWGLHFDAVNDSLPSWKKFYGNETRKVGATEYWDDKAYRVQNGKLMKEAAHEMA